MALLQILDPIAAKPIGIDLGTTHSLVAYVTSTGEPIAIRDCDNDPLVPSVVHYTHDGSTIVGKDAQARAEHYPADTIVSVKRFMGRGADDVETRRLGPYRFILDNANVVQFQVAGGQTVTPIEVSAEILKALKSRAESKLSSISGAVITVPAYFDDAQRQATRDAGRLAGLNVLRLLNEPTAAALAYGLESKQNGVFAIYDLGGGTFDITILSLDKGVFQVKSTGGDSQLGGDDMDRALAEAFLGKLNVEASTVSPEFVRTLLNTSRSAKHALTDAPMVEVSIGLHDQLKTLRITRDEFNELIKPILERTGIAARRSLRDAGIKPRELDGVILVGGATRVPAVREYVTHLFEQEPLSHVDPDQVVALGAAHQAELLAGTQPRDDVLLLDVLPLSLGVEAMGGVVEKILPRNTAIPVEAAQVFTTYADNQTGFELHVVQGERELAQDNRSLARFTLKGIPPMAAGMARLEVRFNVSAEGLLNVSAKELRTGIEQKIEITPSYGLSEQEIERMLIDAFEHGEEDIAVRVLREQQVEAQRIIDALERAMNDDADLLSEQDQKDISSARKELDDALRGSDHRLIAMRIEELDGASKNFAARRMDRSIRNALAGRDVGTIEKETAHAKGIEDHLER